MLQPGDQEVASAAPVRTTSWARSRYGVAGLGLLGALDVGVVTAVSGTVQGEGDDEVAPELRLLWMVKSWPRRTTASRVGSCSDVARHGMAWLGHAAFAAGSPAGCGA